MAAVIGSAGADVFTLLTLVPVVAASLAVALAVAVRQCARLAARVRG